MSTSFGREMPSYCSSEDLTEDELDLKVWDEAKAGFEADPVTISAEDIAKKYL